MQRQNLGAQDVVACLDVGGELDVAHAAVFAELGRRPVEVFACGVRVGDQGFVLEFEPFQVGEIRFGAVAGAAGQVVHHCALRVSEADAPACCEGGAGGDGNLSRGWGGGDVAGHVERGGVVDETKVAIVGLPVGGKGAGAGGVGVGSWVELSVGGNVQETPVGGGEGGQSRQGGEQIRSVHDDKAPKNTVGELSLSVRNGFCAR